MTDQVNEQELTQEELAQRKEEMLQFYTESVHYLKAQCEYEEMLARIDEARFKRMESQIKLAMLMQGPQEAKAPESTDEQKQPEERKLKKN